MLAAACSPWFLAIVANISARRSSMVRSAPPQKLGLPDVITAPLMAESLVTLSTTAPSSSMTSIVITFIERSAISHVMSAIPSLSTSSLKLLMALASPLSHWRSARTLVRLAVLFRVARAVFVAHHHHVDIGIMCAFGSGAGANFDEDCVAFGTIDQAMTVWNAGPPGGGIARSQHRIAVILAQHHFALEHVHKLVLFFMPMSLRGCRSGLERADIDSEMSKAGGAPKALSRASGDHFVEGRRISGRSVNWNRIDVYFRHSLWNPIRRVQ